MEKFSVYQHWDSLETCLVGKCYPPEFFSFINDASTRDIFEKIAIETNEDFDNLTKLLNKFNVNVLRPEFPDDFNELFVDGKWTPPPITPRDYFLMIEDKFYIPNVPNASHAWNTFYRDNKMDNWGDWNTEELFVQNVDKKYHSEFFELFKKFKEQDNMIFDQKMNFYSSVFEHIKMHGNEIVYTELDFINGCFVSRIGENLIFATQSYYDNCDDILDKVNRLFPNTVNQVVKLEGHGDSIYCPVTPGLIISLRDVPTYADTFPDWEVVYLPDSNYVNEDRFETSMKYNKGRYFIPGFEKNLNVVDTVDYYFNEWVGQASETVFHVNILVIDRENIVVSTYDDKVEEACKRYGIEMHVCPFRHKYFWDAGSHCVTNDLNRIGSKEKWINL